ncbi:hypothetical protein WICANDRAFT_79402 [Wickerhamomyces anomalus NRRL Y-366-8]|uniref:Ribosomal protein L1 n=1 Tax=Wickerhamomyces anomalus (strain ATCC 58044 / CBS 1984 / NCYC 433 / NRRL Y-366-8) TaxID=683960 RepID=A0A1E3P1S2_WICAA|nr:uncharacterized protein WICANDRAFT_79402 [Wickerhamomyces anomalus NRRL Y-366-8]ODQ58857.1 hypothetical protein WICANDRAFT_79402 [Wickerhamomyces anomalus NRRL Y-366-8]
MARKVTNKTKVVKKPQAARKPKGKVVKALNVEDVSPDAKEEEPKVAVSKSVKSLVDDKKISKALSELKKFVANSTKEEESKAQLFEDELSNDLQIIFTKKNLFTSKKNFKPKLIHIQDKPQNEEQPKIVLFVRDDVIDKELLEKIEESELNSLIEQIITGSDLKSTYKQYEKRRELYSLNDIFLADDSLITTLPKLLGKVFYDSKKLPIPIKINKENFSIQSVINQVNKISNSIVYSLPRSNNLSVNLGSIETINESVLKQVIEHFQNEELRSIFIKTNQSPALPLYELDTVYTEDDVKPTDKEEIKAKESNVSIEGLPENIKLSEFEKGLIELANPTEIPELFSSKIKKSIKKSKQENKDKVSKPLLKKKTKKSIKA